MSKIKKVEVSKISLQIGGKKKIELSLDEARELQQILADLLGLETERKCDCNKITIIPGPTVVAVPYPYPVPVRPRRYWDWEIQSPYWVGDSPNTEISPNIGTITITSVGIESSSGIVGNTGNVIR